MAASVDEPLDASNITPPRPGGRVDGPRRSLWVGGRPPFDRDLPMFDVLVLCARELQPEHLAFHGQVIRCPLPDDALSMAEVRLALETAKLVARALIDRRHILVTCSAGINRSALVASLALSNVTRLSGDALIRIMRQRRHPNALFNSHFRDLIQKFARPQSVVAPAT
jgi:protein-tyrosine phosphatase